MEGYEGYAATASPLFTMLLTRPPYLVGPSCRILRWLVDKVLVNLLRRCNTFSRKGSTLVAVGNIVKGIWSLGHESIRVG